MHFNNKEWVRVFSSTLPNLTFGSMRGLARLSKEEAARKIRHYCAYQERCHREVKEKLYSFGLYSNDVNEIVANLIEDNYLNEERFAIQFAGGKFRMKQWGRVKILRELQQRGVGTYNIKAALKEIDEEQYTSVLYKLAEKKWASLKTDQYLVRMSKTTTYLLQKGFEPQLVNQTVQAVRAAAKKSGQ